MKFLFLSIVWILIYRSYGHETFEWDFCIPISKSRKPSRKGYVGRRTWEIIQHHTQTHIKTKIERFYCCSIANCALIGRLKLFLCQMLYFRNARIPILRRPSWSYDRWIYNYLCNQCLSPCLWWGIYVIKCVSDLRQVGDFLGVLRFSPPIKRTATIKMKWGDYK